MDGVRLVVGLDLHGRNSPFGRLHPHHPPHHQPRPRLFGLLQQIHTQLLGTEPATTAGVEHGYGVGRHKGEDGLNFGGV